MHEIFEKRKDILREKVQVSAAHMMQRNYRRARDYQKYIYVKREKGDADKRTQTLIVAMFLAVGSLNKSLHPWYRFLPLEIQDVLEQIKNPMQRTIQNVPIKGKLANEEIGKRGLRVASVDYLTYKQDSKQPDLASHMLISVTRHLLSLVPAELFPQTLNWACYSIAHKAVELSKKGSLKQDIIQVGKDMPPHPGDTLCSLYEETAHLQTQVEGFIKLPESSLPMTVLHGLSPHHRQVYLTANVLIIMRQALDSPTLSTEDHLKFQGLDISAGAQLMEVLGSELDHALPLDWPKTYGTVASLAAQATTYITELQPERIKGHGNPKVKKKEKGDLAEAASKAAKKDDEARKAPDSPPDSPKKGKSKAKGKAAPKKSGHRKKKPKSDKSDECGQIAHFNRKATFRLVQQIGFLMKDQHAIVASVLAAEEGEVTTNNDGVRTSRYITVAEKLFQMADASKHDHCSFCLAVVMFHMVLRGLMLRLMYHRAAVAVQKRYRYLKSRGNKSAQIAPAITIQRFYRGLRAALHCMKIIDAGKLIWKNYEIYRYNKRSSKFVHSTLTLQRYWRGALSRQWVRHCHDAATFIQKFVRKLLVRVVLDKPGRDVVRKFQRQINEILKTASERSETEQIARLAAASGKCKLGMEKQRNRNVDMRRALSFNLRSKHTRKQDREKMRLAVGKTQPQRHTVFEPLVFAMARLQPAKQPRLGCVQSRILKQVNNTHMVLDKSLPLPQSRAQKRGSWVCPFRCQNVATGEWDSICKQVNPLGMRNCASCRRRCPEVPHGATKRGRASLIAIRKSKTARMADKRAPLLNVEMCTGWGARMLEPKGF